MEMNFKKVSKGYLAKYKEIYDEAIQNAERYMEIIGDEQHIDAEIIRELEWAKAKYGKPRMSRLITKEEANSVPAGTFKVVITSGNRIRKLEVNAKITDLRGESPKCILVVDNRDSILLFSTLGKVFKIPVSVLSFEFQDIRLVVKKLTSDIASIVMESSMKTFSKNKHHFIYTLSRNGYIKRMDCADFLSIPVSGIIYAKLDPGDEIVDVMFMSDKYDLMVFSENRALRFAGTEAPYLRRSTKGNYSMSTNHPMKGMVCVRPNANALVIITAGGRINKIPLVSIKNGKRTQAGSSVIKLGKGDNIISTLICGENETIHVVFETGKEIDIPVHGIEPGSSISPGKKLGA
jgi:DNA gyrase subunit A